MDNKVPLDPKDGSSLSLEDIFSMHVEYAEYDFRLFHGRLKSLRQTICAMNTRLEIDRRAYENYVSSHPVSLYSHGGYIQWQGQRIILVMIFGLSQSMEFTDGFKSQLTRNSPKTRDTSLTNTTMLDLLRAWNIYRLESTCVDERSISCGQERSEDF
ncbi:hypothetical protein IV203_010845 [Nitzschia inconspicua]|uniref:Uncharacterized protein n=1 Tax=Nitzschia inconspicua TaxID=303405 RepID=A0A9K3KWV5_9STRA|nr:hypothetical protein IV203_010845 [Nitzschia inconspicua]